MHNSHSHIVEPNVKLHPNVQHSLAVQALLVQWSALQAHPAAKTADASTTLVPKTRPEIQAIERWSGISKLKSLARVPSVKLSLCSAALME